MSPSHRCPVLVIPDAARARFKIVRDEALNRLGLSRYVRKRGWDFGQADSLERLARGLFVAAARALLTIRGLPPQRPSHSPEVRAMVSFIVYGDRR